MKPETLTKHLMFLQVEPSKISKQDRANIASAHYSVGRQAAKFPDDATYREQHVKMSKVYRHAFNSRVGVRRQALTPKEVRETLPEPPGRGFKIVKGTEQPWATWTVQESPYVTKKRLAAEKVLADLEDLVNRIDGKPWKKMEPKMQAEVIIMRKRLHRAGREDLQERLRTIRKKKTKSGNNRLPGGY